MSVILITVGDDGAGAICAMKLRNLEHQLIVGMNPSDSQKCEPLTIHTDRELEIMAMGSVDKMYSSNGMSSRAARRAAERKNKKKSRR